MMYLPRGLPGVMAVKPQEDWEKLLMQKIAEYRVKYRV